ncbi:hypothetical protein N326_03151, partial [Eurypyga helias]
QLRVGHIQPSASPWNTPIFVIPKKSGKWHLLHDLRKVNEQMLPMGALQPGLPAPTMIPREWNILIVDLKDCFFTIPLHPDDTRRFAFSLPALNKAAPSQRFEWVVLPQGMRNSPTMCQLFVAAALQPVRQAWLQAIIYHYMDDILVAQAAPFSQEQSSFLHDTLLARGLQIAPEKIQVTRHISDTMVRPQKVTLTTAIHTLRDAQKLKGDLRWVRTIVGIWNEELEPLRPLLKG